MEKVFAFSLVLNVLIVSFILGNTSLIEQLPASPRAATAFGFCFAFFLCWANYAGPGAGVWGRPSELGAHLGLFSLSSLLPFCLSPCLHPFLLLACLPSFSLSPPFFLAACLSLPLFLHIPHSAFPLFLKKEFRLVQTWDSGRTREYAITAQRAQLGCTCSRTVPPSPTACRPFHVSFTLDGTPQP